jgi:hypothetical protein
LIVCGIGIIGLYVRAPMVSSNPLSLHLPPTPTPGEPSECDALDALTVSVTANPSSIALGQSAVVSWSVTTPPGCENASVRLNDRPVAKTGHQTVTPSVSSMYRVTARLGRPGAQLTKSELARVTVTFPSRVVINQSTPNPVAVLVAALNNASDRKVELCNVDLDLTGFSTIELFDHVSLIASPGCERGPNSLGPRIFVTDRRGTLPLFVISGDHVIISGFRLEGPTDGIGSDGLKEEGIRIHPMDSADPIRHIEISNMEIYHWSGAGVEVQDNTKLAQRGRLFNTNPDAVTIRDNFIHHNRHGDGEGYGVSITQGAYALVEQNVFDENRHAITGAVSKNDNGLDYSGYTARDNLILPGGGLHCGNIFCWHTQQIDMHGDQSRWYSGDWECGTAGETIIIERNTILYDDGHAIKIRGNPIDKAVVDGNVFKLGKDDAIAQNGNCGLFGDNITNRIDVRGNNIFDADPMATLGSCDFVGNGEPDQFMATGATWWAKSPKTQQWRYLNTMPEPLTQLQLGDFDKDGKCDVALRSDNPSGSPKIYSKGGTGPWVPLQ